MNKQYLLKSLALGLFLVEGKGFTGSVDQATRFSAEKAANAADCAQKMLGIDTETVEAPVAASASFAVSYIRKGDVVNGQVQPNKRNPSKRRFATRAEANQHGSRFNVRVKKFGDEPGTAGHIGFYVTESTDPVNSSVNWETGLTNSLEAAA